MEISTSTNAKSWRLVHDGATVIAMFESVGVTETAHYLFEAATQAECLAEIARLSIFYQEEEPTSF